VVTGGVKGAGLSTRGRNEVEVEYDEELRFVLFETR
jgi:hypothetical protein